MKKIITLLLVMLMAFSFVGCKGKDTPEVDPLADYDSFTIEDITFYVPKSVKAVKTSVDGYEYAVGNDNFLVFIEHLAIADAKAQNLNLDDIKASVFEGETIQKINNLETIFYDNKVGDTDYHYSYTWVQTDKNVFDFNCICFKDEEATYQPMMEDIISKIVINK